jgi:nucleoside-diphosphate-sugar epimerase
MKIGITGATGRVGTSLTQCLTDHGYDIRILTRQSPTHIEKRKPFLSINPSPIQKQLAQNRNPTIEMVQGDLSRTEDLVNFCRGLDALIHAAYWPGHELQEPEAWMKQNIFGSLNLLESYRSVGGQQFIFISTCSVYSDTHRNEKVSTLSPDHPHHVYGAHKAAIEHLVTGYKYDHNMPYNTNLRPGGPMPIFGFRATDTHGVWSDAMDHLMNGRDASITLPERFCCIDGYDIGTACLEIVEQRDKRQRDLYLQDHGTISAREAQRIFHEYFPHHRMNIVIDKQSHHFSGNIIGETNLFTPSSQLTLHRHIRSWQARHN